MSVTHSIRSASFSGPGESLGGTSTAVVGGGATNISEAIAAGASNLAITASYDVSAMKSLFILATTVDLTVAVVSADSPNPSLSLLAGQAITWLATSGEDNPFGATDVTGLLVTNADGSTAGQLDVRVISDVTP
jgi:hypothetical protein